jgi:hypothetical protein
LGAIKESVAWRDEWAYRLTCAIATDSSRNYDEFFAWWRQGITRAIIARLGAIPEGGDRSAYVRTLKVRWQARDSRLYERLDIPPALWEGFASFVRQVFEPFADDDVTDPGGPSSLVATPDGKSAPGTAPPKARRRLASVWILVGIIVVIVVIGLLTGHR